MSEAGRFEVLNQKEIVLDEEERNIPEIDATKYDQPIADADEQSETDHYEGFHDIGFMAEAVVPTIPLSFIYLNSYFEGGGDSS